jgi:hypothetical protein
MSRTRISTAVDAALLAGARAPATDAALVDEALTPLLDRQRAAEIDASDAAYDDQPIGAPDE